VQVPLRLLFLRRAGRCLRNSGQDARLPVWGLASSRWCARCRRRWRRNRHLWSFVPGRVRAHHGRRGAGGLGAGNRERGLRREQIRGDRSSACRPLGCLPAPLTAW